MSPGDEFILFDDAKHAFVKLLKVNKQNIECIALNFFQNQEPKLSIILAVGAVRQSVFEEIVQNCAAIGVKQIIQVKTEKSQASGQFNQSRINSIATSAREQAKNYQSVNICQAISMEDFFNLKHQGIKLFADPEGLILSSQILDCQEKQAVIFIGPPEGLTEKEIILLKNANFARINLGKNILKTELASTLAAGIVSALSQNI